MRFYLDVRARAVEQPAAFLAGNYGDHLLVDRVVHSFQRQAGEDRGLGRREQGFVRRWLWLFWTEWFPKIQSRGCSCSCTEAGPSRADLTPR
jgi:hypothetical protein